MVTYNEIKEDTSGGDEAGCVQYDYARPTDVAHGVMGLEPSAHNAVLLTPMYKSMSDAPCAPAKVSMNTCINTLVYMVATYICDRPREKGACAIYCHLRKSSLKFAHIQ